MDVIEELLSVLDRYDDLGIAGQIDYNKFYLYSIITHSTAIEGSTVTELENQILFDEGISISGKTLAEQMMNLDLKAAYEESMALAKQHEEISPELLKHLSSLVMKNTGTVYKTALGDFSSAQGEFRLLNVSAGVGGPSYLNYNKIPGSIDRFCNWLNQEREKSKTVAEKYILSFEAHYNLVTIHPWADGNGRMARLVMNHIQFENGLIPSKVLKEDKVEYIKALNRSRESGDVKYFVDFMLAETVKTLTMEIESFLASSEEDFVLREYTPKRKLKSREAILELLAEHPEYSSRKLAQAIGITSKGVEKHLARFKKEGIIRREGPDKGGRWIIS